MSDPTFTITKVDLDALKADVAQMTTMLNAFVPDVAGVPPPGAPTITNAIAMPNALPAGGGPVTINATVQNATAVTLDGVAVTLPTTVNVSTSKTFALVATGVTAPPATVSLAVTVAGVVIVPPPSGSLSTLAPGFARNLGSYLTGAADGFNGANITDYSGMAYNEVDEEVMLFGGGHGPYQEGALRGCKPGRLPLWRSVIPPTPLVQMTFANGDSELGRWISTNQPYARHTYATLVMIARKLHCRTPTGMPDHLPPPWPAWGGHCWAFDFDTGLYSYSAIDNAHTPGDYGVSSCADPVSGNIIAAGDGKNAGAGSLSVYTPGSDTITLGPFAPQFANHKILRFPDDDSFYVMGDWYGTLPPGGVTRIAYNRSNLQSSTFTAIPGAGNYPASGGCYAFDYNPNKKNFGGFATSVNAANNGKFFEWSPVTKIWTRTPIQVEAGSSGSPVAQWWCNVFHKAEGCYIFPGSPLTGDTWAYRPPA